ncbi:hypothetical protein FACS189496_4320 [Bacilli bacterium]|nr:hypothetical protein FACS189496_4320 [Bacilli bacterium]
MARHSLHILLVDCNKRDAEWLAVLINSRDHDVDKVTSCDEAIKFLYKKGYNLLFYTVNPKDMDASNFIKLVREIDDSLSVIPVYPYVPEHEVEQDIRQKEEEIKAKDEGAIAVLRKPLNVVDIEFWMDICLKLLDFGIKMKKGCIDLLIGWFSGGKHE